MRLEYYIMNCVERCRYIHLFTEMFCLSAQTLILLMAFAVVQSLGYPEIHSNQSGKTDNTVCLFFLDYLS